MFRNKQIYRKCCLCPSLFLSLFFSFIPCRPLCLHFVVRVPEAVERRVHTGQQSNWSITPPSLSPSVQASLCFWQLLLTIMDVSANFCENWHIWQLKCHMPYRIFFGRFPHLYNRWIRYKSGSLLIHSLASLFFPHFISLVIFVSLLVFVFFLNLGFFFFYSRFIWCHWWMTS